jgi:hypothetical protein
MFYYNIQMIYIYVIRSLSAKMDLERKQIASLHIRNQDLSSDLSKMQLSMSILENDLSEKRKEISELKFHADSLKISIDQLRTAAALDSESIIYLKNEIVKLEAQVETEKYSNDLKTSEAQSILAELTASNAEVDSLHAQADSYREMLKAQKQQQDADKDKIIELDAEIDRQRQCDEISLLKLQDYNNASICTKNTKDLSLSQEGTDLQFPMSSIARTECTAQEVGMYAQALKSLQDLSINLRSCLETPDASKFMSFLDELCRCYQGADINDGNRTLVSNQFTCICEIYREIVMLWMKDNLSTGTDYDWKELAEVTTSTCLFMLTHLFSLKALVNTKVELAQCKFEIEVLKSEVAVKHADMERKVNNFGVRDIISAVGESVRADRILPDALFSTSSNIAKNLENSSKTSIKPVFEHDPINHVDGNAISARRWSLATFWESAGSK